MDVHLCFGAGPHTFINSVSLYYTCVMATAPAGGIMFFGLSARTYVVYLISLCCCSSYNIKINVAVDQKVPTKG